MKRQFPNRCGRQARKRSFMIGVAFGATLLTTGADLNSATQSSGSANSGRSAQQIYHDYCSVCHGDRGDGNSRASNSLNPRPRDFTSPQAERELSRERMIISVTEGRPGTAMTAWKTQLSAAVIETVVDHIRTNMMRAESPAGTSNGRDIYVKSCSVCHGDRGSGSLWASKSLNPPPRDFSSSASKAELTRERMIASVTYGRSGTAMAGFQRQLGTADVEAVVDYIRSAFMAAAETAAAPAGREPAKRDAMPQGLKGDAARGKRFYLANCATCHGARGDGEGPRAYFINPKPRNFLSARSRQGLSRSVLFEAIGQGRVGSEMPAWDKVLTAQQIADVAEFVFQAFIAEDKQVAR